MLTGLLITLNILVCIALIGVVLLQRSEGGGFVSGSTSSLITARGAGDLLTRTTWILFGLFMALSLGLTLLGAHDRTTSSLAEKLKQQHANVGAMGQTNSATPQAPASSAPLAPSPAGSTSPFLAPPLSAPPAATPAPSAIPAPAHPAKRPVAALRGPAPAAAPIAAQSQPAGASPAAPVLVAPPPQPAPRTVNAPPPKPDPNAPVSTGSP